jgi:hypothetical protein
MAMKDVSKPNQLSTGDDYGVEPDAGEAPAYGTPGSDDARTAHPEPDADDYSTGMVGAPDNDSDDHNSGSLSPTRPRMT